MEIVYKIYIRFIQNQRALCTKLTGFINKVNGHCIKNQRTLYAKSTDIVDKITDIKDDNLNK